MDTVTPQMDEWKALPWKQFQRTVFRLQKRIYQASLRGDTRQVRQLQKLLSKSRAAKLLAVRKVTQDNQGKRTAGIDGVKSLTDKQRLRLSRRLSFRCAAKPLRRVWIPKPGSTEKRPLGIPVMRDRALQALVKLALEPEWEARFEPNSYGFRPGRSAHDAIGAIYSCINQRAKWVLDADIEKCFDRIDHARLLAKVDTMPLFRRLLKGWLQAGVMDEEVFQPVATGTPQGGVISPLLANIYLHYAFDLWVKQWRGRHARGDVIVVRYADDWVAGFQFRDDAERFKRAVAERLGQFGLKLHPEKTRLIEFGRFARDNRSRRGQGKPQTFDFLGFTHCCAKTRKGKFMVLRLTSAKRLQAKLKAVKLELRRRMHRPIAEQGPYLRAVVAGHGRYFGVPNNGARLSAFRFQVGRLWHRTLCRRSQSHHLRWRRMHRLIEHWLPVPRICHPYPNQRLIVTTQGKSRVR